jgi:hypothetical protein
MAALLTAACLLLNLPAKALAARAFAAPVAVSFTTAVPVNAQSMIQLQGSDPDGTPLSYATTTTPAHGTLSQFNASTGALIYTPSVGYTGADSFQYTVTSGGDTTGAAAVTITVTNAKTRIVDTFINPDGSPRKGKISFFLTQVASSPGGIIPAKSSVSCQLTTGGACDVSVYPSRAVSPVQYYQVWHDDSTTGNSQLLGLYDIPASPATISLVGRRITDANLTAQYAFASRAEVEALTKAVADATLSSLNSTQVTTALGYTPLGPSSPTVTGTMTAEAVTAKSLALTGVGLRDEFTSANGTSNVGRAPSHTNNPQTSWQCVSGNWVIQNGRAQPSSTSYTDGTHCFSDTGTSDHTVSVSVTGYYAGSAATGSKPALLLRYVDDNNHWAVLMDVGSNVTALYEKTNGVYTQRGPAVSAAASSQQQTHLSAVASGDTITWNITGQKPVVVTGATAHQTATKAGVLAFKGSGTPGAVPTFDDFNASPSLMKYGSNPVITRAPATWKSNDVCGPSAPVWDALNNHYTFFICGFDGTNWTEGVAYLTVNADGTFAITEEPTNPRVTPISGEGGFASGMSRAVYKDGAWYAVAYINSSGTPGNYVFPLRIIGLTSPNLNAGGTWTRLNGGAPILPLGASGSIDEGGHHDPDLRLRTDGKFEIVMRARNGAGTKAVIGHAICPTLLTCGTVTQANVMGRYGAASADDLGSPSFDGDDPLVYSINFERHPGAAERYRLRADTEDGGVTFTHVGMVLGKGSATWESVQVFDYGGAVRIGDRGVALYAGAPNPGGDANLGEDIGLVTFTWPKPAQVLPQDTGFVTLDDGAIITLDFGNNPEVDAAVTLGGNRALAATRVIPGAQFYLFVKQDATGGRQLALPAGWKVEGGGAGAVTLTATPNAVDLLYGKCLGAGMCYLRKALNFN